MSTAPINACGECTLCCKVLGVAQMNNKPAGTWCEHCTIGGGCQVYIHRPAECREFDCVYRFDAKLGPEWRPDRARFVLVYELGGKRLTARCDPARPDAWKRQPYHAGLRAMAKQLAPRGIYVLVDAGGRAVVMLPERDVDLGLVGPDERIVTTLFGPKLDAVKVHESDPKAHQPRWTPTPSATR